MSNQSLHENSLRRVASQAGGLSVLRRPVEALAFWSAIVLPFLYVPLFFTGLRTAGTFEACVVLIVAHVVALVLGREYGAE